MANAGKLRRKFSRAANDATAEAEPYAQATAYLADTLEWLNLWQDNACHAEILDGDCTLTQDRGFPQP